MAKTGKMVVIPPCEVCENSTNVVEDKSGDWLCTDCGFTWERGFIGSTRPSDFSLRADNPTY